MNGRRLLLILAAVLFGTMAFEWIATETEKAKKRLPISQFVAAVEKGTFTKVIIHGNDIIGEAKGVKRFSYATDKARLVAVLEEKRVPYEEREKKEHNPLTTLLWIAAGATLLIALLGFALRRTMGGKVEALTKFTDDKSVRQERAVTTTFADVAGVDEAKEEVADIVDFLREPEKYAKLGARIPKGILLDGPPGAGKTLLARALAGEAKVTFLSASGSDFVEMYVGVGAARIRSMFERARKLAPCIMFIDEIDALAKARGGGIAGLSTNDEREQTLNQLLSELDGFTPNSGIVVVGATNRFPTLDKALVRPGRFDRVVAVPLPDVRGREAILAVHAPKFTLHESAELSVIARATPGMSGAELEQLLNEAALACAKAGKTSIDGADLMEARDKVMMGAARKSAVMSEKDRRRVAVHEAGHTLVAQLTAGAAAPRRVTIVPRRHALGATLILDDADRHIRTKTELQAELAVLMGGREAERLLLGDVSTGAENDLAVATRLAEAMVKRFAMGDDSSLAPRSFDPESESAFAAGLRCAPATTAQYDIKVGSILTDAKVAAMELIRLRAARVEALAAALEEHETLDEAAIEAIIGPKRR